MKIINSKGSIWRKWDLHLHSTASDGKCTPEELVDESIAKGIDVIALTDHHTVNNIDEIKRLGKEKGLGVIAGIEFRTEYGQKSVHMIGLFPDKFESTILNEAALNDLVLAPLGLSKTEITRAARSTGKTFRDDSAAYKEGLLQVQVDFKKAANLIHKYGGLVSVHAGSKANSFEEEMKHEGSGPRNVSDLADSLGTVKEELLREYIDICEVRNSKEAPFYQDKYNKPALVNKNWTQILLFSSVNIRLPYNAMLLLFLS
ncbi:MAG TPA: PHP domain-containing protein [Candidatus Faecimorpha stercoravium]|nr:PHP domain-containing protein [Candidatus Faecimorpha stercoravium]